MLGSILGSAVSAGISGLFSSRQASNQMAFQERMSNTSHQREVADLKAAGLNPVLSAMGGSGASSPSGAMGAISVPDIGAGITNARLQGDQAKLMQAQTSNAREQARSTRINADLDAKYGAVQRLTPAGVAAIGAIGTARKLFSKSPSPRSFLPSYPGGVPAIK